MKKSSILSLIYAAAAMSSFNHITNPYDGLPEMRYNGDKKTGRASTLNKKQREKRKSKNTRAKLSRKRNRK